MKSNLLEDYGILTPSSKYKKPIAAAFTFVEVLVDTYLLVLDGNSIKSVFNDKRSFVVFTWLSVAF
jgi:hypothetical protein